ncbi:ATP-binding protein [Paralysiella testudinis]|uniref:histidine kinase n=1 Tax=Paralysiella testudinis TaxID=2809020 RepID=A0A892ZHY9_9NEIS|nr:ATP-binding protein [Paralysiella testudinis]QRQ83175.1 sensor histidine kinase [Paralysiella testudinis]
MKNKVGKASGSRYRSLIVSIAVLVVLFVLILLVNIFSSNRIQNANQTVTEAGYMQTSIQSIIKELYNLKLYYGEDPNSPVVKASLQSLRDNQKLFNEHLHAFSTGGQINDEHGQVQLSGLTDPEIKKSLVTLQENWQPLNEVLSTYLKDAGSIRNDSTTLDLAVLSAQDKNRILFSEVSAVAEAVQEQAQTTATVLRWIQVAAIAVVLAYFIFFIRFFMSRLLSADRSAAQANEEIKEIMTTVNSGLFLLDRNLKIGSQYSTELIKILGRKDIAGLSLVDLLKDLVNSEDVQMTHSFVNQLYNGRVKEKLIADLNPLSRIQVTMQSPQGESVVKYLDFRFNRVYNGKEIIRILGSVADTTDAVRLQERLQQEREQSDTQLQMLGSLVSADPSVMNDFIEKVNRYSNQINQTLKDPSNTPSALRYKVDSIAREIHTIKGEASALNLGSFVDLANEFENHLKNLKEKNKLVGEDFLPLTVSLEELLTLTSTINDLNSKVGHDLNNASAHGLPAIVFKTHIEKFIADLGMRNRKQVGVSFGNADVLNSLKPEKISLLREMVVQLLRNSVAHGIESAEERTAKGKLAVGHVHIQFNQTGNELYFSVEDDGAGIDYEKIRAKVGASMSPSDAAQLTVEQLNRYIFIPNFSTLDYHNDDAGRGVGLDAVKTKIMELGGKLKLMSEKGAFTRFMFKIPN